MHGPPVVPGHPTVNTTTAFLRAEHTAPTTQPPSYERGGLSKEPSHHTEDQWVAAAQERSDRRSQASCQPQEQAHIQSPTRLPLSEHYPTTVVAKSANAEYVKQLREQMTPDSASAQGARENERVPAAASTTLPEQGEALLHALEAAKGGPGSSTYTAIDRKANYARQLREQMATDEAMRHAMEIERKKMAAPSSFSAVPASGGEEADTRGGRSVGVGGPVRDAKAEYARQLREQMAAKEHAQQAAKGRLEKSPSTHAGPGWIENATEGRKARRKRSNTEYAEQLRAQIAAQKGIHQVQRGQISSYMELPTGSYQQRHQHGPEEVDSMEERRRRPEWQRSWNGNQDGQEGNNVEHSQRRLEGEQTLTRSQGETHNSLAVER